MKKHEGSHAKNIIIKLPKKGGKEKLKSTHRKRQAENGRLFDGKGHPEDRKVTSSFNLEVYDKRKYLSETKG